jgi:hypothetical protein
VWLGAERRGFAQAVLRPRIKAQTQTQKRQRKRKRKWERRRKRTRTRSKKKHQKNIQETQKRRLQHMHWLLGLL